MTKTFRPRTLILFLGDIFFFTFSLWLSLFLRTFTAPSQELFLAHLVPFSLLFVVWVVVFVIAGLYESQLLLLTQRTLVATLLVSQCINMILAALFFFFVPLFGIAPKTLLAIYLVVSFCLVLLWRAVLFPAVGLRKPAEGFIIGENPEIEELGRALSTAPRSPVHIIAILRPSSAMVTQTLIDAVSARQPRFIVADMDNPLVSAAFPQIYTLIARGVRFIEASMLYEQVFRRIPLSYIDARWVARNVSRTVHALYDPLKRLIDMVVGGVLGTLSLVAYPFIIVAIKLGDGGPAFIVQERVGQLERPIRLIKFRTMTGNDSGKYQGGGSALRVTGVGAFLRVTRLDELPQLWNVVRGDLSLIGPRPELPALVSQYEEAIPYYRLRHLIKPGLSGWAQLYHDNHPHHGVDVEATREKLSYDLYYLKHRSLLLDCIVILKTIKKLLTRSGK